MKIEFDEVSIKLNSYRTSLYIFLNKNYFVSVFISGSKTMQFSYVVGTQQSMLGDVEGTQRGMLRVRNSIDSCFIELPNTVVL